MLNNSRDRRLVGLMGLILLLSVVAVGFLGTRANSQDLTQTPLDSVDAKLLLDTNGLVLARPDEAQVNAARVTRESAIEVALEADPDFTVLEADLALISSPVVSANGCICWAISMRPPGGDLQEFGPPGMIPGKREDIYYITFVDAGSGLLHYSAVGGREVEPARIDPDFELKPLVTPVGSPPAGR